MPLEELLSTVEPWLQSSPDLASKNGKGVCIRYRNEIIKFISLEQGVSVDHWYRLMFCLFGIYNLVTAKCTDAAGRIEKCGEFFSFTKEDDRLFSSTISSTCSPDIIGPLMADIEENKYSGDSVKNFMMAVSLYSMVISYASDDGLRPSDATSAKIFNSMDLVVRKYLAQQYDVSLDVVVLKSVRAALLQILNCNGLDYSLWVMCIKLQYQLHGKVSEGIEDISCRVAKCGDFFGCNDIGEIFFKRSYGYFRDVVVNGVAMTAPILIKAQNDKNVGAASMLTELSEAVGLFGIASRYVDYEQQAHYELLRSIVDSMSSIFAGLMRGNGDLDVISVIKSYAFEMLDSILGGRDGSGVGAFPLPVHHLVAIRSRVTKVHPIGLDVLTPRSRRVTPHFSSDSIGGSTVGSSDNEVYLPVSLASLMTVEAPVSKKRRRRSPPAAVKKSAASTTASSATSTVFGSSSSSATSAASSLSSRPPVFLDEKDQERILLALSKRDESDKYFSDTQALFRGLRPDGGEIVTLMLIFGWNLDFEVLKILLSDIGNRVCLKNLESKITDKSAQPLKSIDIFASLNAFLNAFYQGILYGHITATGTKYTVEQAANTGGHVQVDNSIVVRVRRSDKNWFWELIRENVLDNTMASPPSLSKLICILLMVVLHLAPRVFQYQSRSIDNSGASKKQKTSKEEEEEELDDIKNLLKEAADLLKESPLKEYLKKLMKSILKYFPEANASISANAGFSSSSSSSYSSSYSYSSSSSYGYGYGSSSSSVFNSHGRVAACGGVLVPDDAATTVDCSPLAAASVRTFSSFGHG